MKIWINWSEKKFYWSWGRGLVLIVTTEILFVDLSDFIAFQQPIRQPAPQPPGPGRPASMIDLSRQSSSLSATIVPLLSQVNKEDPLHNILLDLHNHCSFTIPVYEIEVQILIKSTPYKQWSTGRLEISGKP